MLLNAVSLYLHSAVALIVGMRLEGCSFVADNILCIRVYVYMCCAGGEGSFTFSPAARQPDMLLSPRGAASSFRGRRSNLMSTPERPDSTAAAAAAAQDSSSMTPNLRPNRLFDTPVAAATPQQSSAARPNTHATPEAAVEEAAAGGRAGAAAAGVKVRKLTFDLAAPSAAAAAAAAKSNLQKGPGVASAKSAASNSSSGSGHISTSTEAPKARVGGIKFELGESTMAVSVTQTTLVHNSLSQIAERSSADSQRFTLHTALWVE